MQLRNQKNNKKEGNPDTQSDSEGQQSENHNASTQPVKSYSEHLSSELVIKLLAYLRNFYTKIIGKEPSREEKSSQEQLKSLPGQKCSFSGLFTPFNEADFNLHKIHRNQDKSDPIKVVVQLYQQLCRELEKKLLSSKRFKKVETFTDKLVIIHSNCSKHSEIVSFQIQLLSFTTQILILNEVGDNPLPKQSQGYVSGGFGSVYFHKFNQDQVAIKSLPLSRLKHKKSIEQYSQTLIETLQQYFFVLLFSQLQIGPQAKLIGGFDIIVYQNDIVFGTQLCSSPIYGKSQAKQSSQSLLKMHMLQIIHRDIKPANIMYSPSFHKNVFIDFGCTDVVRQKIGQKNFTVFKGTTAYCTDALFSLTQKPKGFVDLYQNDVYSLQKTLEQLKFKKPPRGQIQLTSSKKFVYQMIKIKYHLYRGDYERFFCIWNQAKNLSEDFEQFQKEVLKYFPEVQLNWKLKKFYWEQIEENIRDLEIYKDLKTLFKKQNVEVLCHLLKIPEKQKDFALISSQYSFIQIKYSPLSKLQKQITIMLDSKDSVENFIDTLKVNLKYNKLFTVPIFKSQIRRRANLKKGQNGGLINEQSSHQKIQFNQNQKTRLMKENMMIMCLVIANYSSMSKNKYNTSYNQKIEACQLALAVLKEIEWLQLENCEFLFINMVDEKVNIMITFYQVYALKISHLLPESLQETQFVHTFLNLAFLGCPFEFTSHMKLLVEGFLVDSGLQSSYNEQEGKSGTSGKKLLKAISILKMSYLILMNLSLKEVFSNVSSFKINKVSSQNLERIDLLIFDLIKEKKQKHLDKTQIQFIELTDERTWLVHGQQKEKLILQQINILTGERFREKCKQSFQFYRFWLISCIQVCSLRQIDSLEGLKEFFLSIKSHFSASFFKHYQLLYYIVLDNLYEIFLIDPLPSIFDRIDSIVNSSQISFRFKIWRRIMFAFNRSQYSIISEVKKILKNDFCVQSWINSDQFQIMFLPKLIWLHLFKTYVCKGFMNPQFQQVLRKIFPLVQTLLEIGYKYLQQFPCANCIYSISLGQITQKQFRQALQKTNQRCNFYLYLIKVVEQYRGIKNNTDSADLTIQKQQQKLKHKYQFLPIHLTFLENLTSTSIVFNYITKWVEVIEGNQELFQLFKSNKNIRNLFFKLQINFRQQFDSSPLQFERFLSHFLQTQLISEKEIQDMIKKMSSLSILLDYLARKIYRQKYKSSLCQKMIELYRFCQQNKKLGNFLTKKLTFQSLLNSYFYTHKHFNDFLVMIRQFTKLLKEEPSKNHIYIFHHIIYKFFWCNCPVCLPKSMPQIQITLFRFVIFIGSKINLFQSSNQPYLSLLYAQCLDMNKIPLTLMKKMVVYILKSIPYLKAYARQILVSKLFTHVYLVFESFKRRQLLQKKGVEQQMFFSNCIPCIFTKAQNGLRMHRKYLYARWKSQKYLYDKNRSFQNFFNSMLIKQRYYKDWSLPCFIKLKYLKKLERPWNIKQK